MANTIQIKRKLTTGAPSVGSLSDGEMCLVVPDSALYQRVDASTLIQINGGGSSKEYASFYLGTGGLTGLSNTAVTLALNNTRVNSDNAVFSLSANQLTVNKAGTYKISYDTYINNSSTARTEYSIWYEINNTEPSGARSAVYQRGYDSGQSAMINDIVTFSTGDVIRFRIQRTDGSSVAGYQDANGTRLTIEEK